MQEAYPVPDGAQERARWTASGPAWDRWADPVAELADRLNQPLLDAAGVMPGERVLDLASGAGEPAFSAARRTGPTGAVVGIDFVPSMLAGAVRRVQAAGAGPAPVFAVGDMTALPFCDAGFDRATCRFGIMFVPDAHTALTETVRVIRPGGRAAFMVWGPLAENTLFAESAAAIDAVLGPDPQQTLTPLFRYQQAGDLATAMTAAGFQDVEERELRPTGRVPLERAFWRANLDMVFATRLAGQPAEIMTAIDEEARRRFAARAIDGVCHLAMHVRLTAGSVGKG
jgi:SAM-dependent methyltransferase